MLKISTDFVVKGVIFDFYKDRSDSVEETEKDNFSRCIVLYSKRISQSTYSVKITGYSIKTLRKKRKMYWLQS